MDYTMRRPCDLCPFTRTGLLLSPSRARELGAQMVGGRGEFVCHKTATVDEDSGGFVGKPEGSMHCAGALIFAEKQDAPTQMMRICERLGFYDRRNLDMTADVFDDLAEMIDCNRKRAARSAPHAPAAPRSRHDQG